MYCYNGFGFILNTSRVRTTLMSTRRIVSTITPIQMSSKSSRQSKKHGLLRHHSPANYPAYGDREPSHASNAPFIGAPLTDKDLLIPELQDKYELCAVLGRGNQGDVYLARARSSNACVAIKQISIDSISSWKAYDLFHREVETLSMLDMPGIARFHEAAEHLAGSRPAAAIVQDYIDGHTLAEMIRLGHRFSLTRIFQIACQLIDLLDKLHHHDPPIIHRDIKPSNIILTPTPSGFDVTLIDFGAVANPQIQSGGSTVAGTYGYMPPEQITGHPEPASDIYALGVMLVSLISGVSPDAIQVKDFRLIIDPLLENIPPQIVPVLRQMTEPLVKIRLTDHQKIRDIFQAFAKGNYEIPSLETVTDITPETFDQKLREVNAFGQPGNVELWQMLGDNDHRRKPDAYLHPVLRDSPETRALPPLMNFIAHNPFSIALVMMFASFLALFYLISIVFSFSWYACLLTLPLIAYIILAVNAVNREKRHAFVKSLYEDRFKNSLYINDYYKLITDGRRSMATVIDIEYKQPSIEKMHKFDQSSYVCEQPAEFHIRYKFNPPDDNNPNDLIRTYISPNMPNLHPGDPLPILYLIHKTIRGAHDVISMPFPIPLQDITDLNRIVSSRDT
ncbi:MAG: serine/threonine protein kinase [Proteobacteria bacterium]|nr:serine/threonine protein kinase [Pseudomonadota bacterium]